MRKLFLHVGIHRTATTSIQQFLRANSQVLLAQGWLYPYDVVRHNTVLWRLVYGVQTVADFAADLNRRANNKGSPVTSIILSDEDMSSVSDFSMFAELRQYFDVKVVVMLRRQDLWLESWYLQNIKWQWNEALAHLTFEEFFDLRQYFHWLDYAGRLGQYGAVFGADNVIAGVFEPAEMPNGPIDAFLRLIGITDHTDMGAKLHENTSLSPLASEFMRQLPLDEVAEPERYLFEQACLSVDAGLITNGSKLIMSHEQRRIVQAEHATGNRQIAQRYLGRDVLFREPLPAADALLADSTLPPDSELLMQGFVAPMVKALGALLAEARIAADDKGGANIRKVHAPKKDRVKPRT